jgi:hypothetical protein
MQYSALFLAFATLALAAPTTMPKRQFPTQFNPKEDITAAAKAWLQDTASVSSFLDFATSTFPSSPPNLLSKGVFALNAEKDELDHKMILDNFFIFETRTPNEDVIEAFNILVTEGKFQKVVDGLQDISTTGNLADVAIINKNRCKNVLPAIDVYFKAVAEATGQSEFVPAVRPAACGGQFHG